MCHYIFFPGPLSKFGSIAANEIAILLFSNQDKINNGNTKNKHSNNENKLENHKPTVDNRLKPKMLVGSVVLSSLLGGILSTLFRLLLMPMEVCKTGIYLSSLFTYDCIQWSSFA